MATWSDSKAVKEYQEFLESGEQEVVTTDDLPSVILLPGDVSQYYLMGNSIGPEDNDNGNEYNAYFGAPEGSVPETAAAWKQAERPMNTAPGTETLAKALFDMGLGGDMVLFPGQPLPDVLEGATSYPIYITLPPWHIRPFLDHLPPSYEARSDDFVFFSGGPYYGNIEDVLKDKGCCRDSTTQVVISGLHVNKFGTAFDTGVTMGMAENGEEKRAGFCTACGKWKGAIAERLLRGNVQCEVDFYREWRRKMYERTVLDAIFVLLGSVRDDASTTIRQVAKYYEEEVAELSWELSGLLRGWKALTLLYGFEERMLGWAEDAPDAVVGELACRDILQEHGVNSYPYVWGNSVVLQSKLYVEYLWYAHQEMNLFPGIELPPQRGDDGVKSIMRTGVLRADGKI
jgi:hypothetical protein